jgi:hypothetical protein
MPLRPGSITISLLCNCALLLVVSTAKGADSHRVQHPAQVAPAAKRGLITTRLARGHLKRWKSIERLVFATDDTGHALHPTLQRLWVQLAQSRHAIYIELSASRHYYGVVAGFFSVEEFDPQGNRHVFQLKLRLRVIDHALVSSITARPNGFIAFQGLTKAERYAEVLGHELGHAVWGR